ncbi:MAG TPA: TRAP transporter substrate-binding protein DctP, partial [Polyangia bacterium]
MRLWVCFLAVVAVDARVSTADSAEPHAIKLATLAPEGTLWSRELHVMAQEIDAGTNGAVHIKLYLGAVAGDETEVAARIGKGQLDAVASAGVACDRASPTLRAISIPGLFTTRAEGVAVSMKLRATMEAEAEKAGYQLLGVSALGQDVIFTRRPVRTMGELRALKLWRWDGDDAGIATARAMGLTIVPTPVPDAMAAMEGGRLDGFMAIPTAALAFQWSTQARYITDLRSGYLTGCVAITDRGVDLVPVAQ